MANRFSKISPTPENKTTHNANIALDDGRRGEKCRQRTTTGTTGVPHRLLLTILLLLLFGSCATTNEQTVRNGFSDHNNAFVQNAKQNLETASGENDKEPNVVTLDGTLEKYTAYAMKNSPVLEAQFQRWQSSIQRISQSRRLPDPVISYAFYLSSVETRVGPQRHKVSLKQSFPWPTKLSAGSDAASAKAQSAEKRFDALAISIRAAVEEKYWTLWQLSEVRKVHQAHGDLLAGLSETASAQVMTGKIDLAELQQIDLTTARIADLLHGVEERRIQAGAALKGVIGAPQTMTVTATSAPTISVGGIDEAELLTWVRNHPTIGSFESLALGSEAEAKREESNRYPNFSLGVDWIETGRTSMPDVTDSGKDAVIVGVGISVPLWQRNYKESVQAFESEMRAYRADAKAAEDQAVAVFYATVSGLRDAKRRIELYTGTLVPQGESVFESVLGAYVAGRSNVASVLLAQRDLLDLQMQFIDAQADYVKSWAALENIVGRQITPSERNSKQSDDPQRDDSQRDEIQ